MRQMFATTVKGLSQKENINYSDLHSDFLSFCDSVKGNETCCGKYDHHVGQLTFPLRSLMAYIADVAVFLRLKDSDSDSSLEKALSLLDYASAVFDIGKCNQYLGESANSIRIL